MQCDECGHGLWVAGGGGDTEDPAGGRMVGGGMERVCDVMAPRGLERLHTDTGYGDGSYLGLGPGQVLGHVLPDQRLAQLQPHVVRQPGVRSNSRSGGAA